MLQTYASLDHKPPDEHTRMMNQCEFTNDIEGRGRVRCVIHTSSIGPTSRMSFFSVGMNLTRTFCSCRYLSLKAESCALKSNSYMVLCGKKDHLKAYSFHPHNNKRNKAIAYPPSSLMGNNKNTRLLDPQKASSFLVSLQTWYEPTHLCFWSQKNEKREMKKTLYL